MSNRSHIFIVGLSRTGTNLVRKFLNQSTQVALCDETHYLPHWFGYRGYQHELAQVADIRTGDGVRRVVDYIYQIKDSVQRGRNFWGWVQRNVTPAQFEQALLASDRSERAILDVIMGLYAEANGDAPIRGEKTPAHLHNVPTLLRWYPNAKVIHTFRDPRAIYVSQRQWNLKREQVHGPYKVLRHAGPAMDVMLSAHLTTYWLRAARLHQQYVQQYPNRYFLSRFEDLLADQPAQVERICDFVGVEVTRAMLDFSHSSFQNSTVTSPHSVQGVDAQAAERWKQHIHPLAQQWITFWGRRHLQAMGYQT